MALDSSRHVQLLLQDTVVVVALLLLLLLLFCFSRILRLPRNVLTFVRLKQKKEATVSTVSLAQFLLIFKPLEDTLT